MTSALSALFERWQPVVENGVLDPLRVADMHRRHAYRPSEEFMVTDISATLYKLGCAMTWLGDEKPFGHEDHKYTTTMMAVFLSDLAGRAKVAGATEILLPLADKAPMADYMQNVLKAHDIDFPFSFRESPYDLDLSQYGEIDMSITDNPLYKGNGGFTTIIGLWNIDQDRKGQWDHEISQAKPISGKTGRAFRPAP